MADKTYEYFGVKNAGQRNPLMAARYGRGQLYGQRLNNIATGQADWQKDPYYMLGATLGQAWADNYNERGINKGNADMREALNGYLGKFAPQQQSEHPLVSGEEQGPLNQTVQDRARADATKDLPQLTMDGSAPAPDASQLGQGLQYFDQNGNFNMQQPDIKGAKLMYRYNKYANSDNPTTEAIQNKQDVQQLNDLGNNVDFSKANKEDAREQVRDYLVNVKHRTPYQAEQVLGQFDSLWDSKESKWHEAKGTDFLNKGINALQGDGENGPDYSTAFANFVAATQHGNKQAQAYLQRLQYMQNRADKLADEERADQRSWNNYLKKMEYERENGIGSFRPTGVGSRGGSGTGKQTSATTARKNTYDAILNDGEVGGGTTGLPSQGLYNKAWDEFQKAAKDYKDEDGNQLPFEEWPQGAQVRYQRVYNIIQAGNPSATFQSLGYNPDSPDDINEALQAEVISEDEANYLLEQIRNKQQ